MDGPSDRQAIVDCLFDTDNAAVMAELEGGHKSLSWLAGRSGLSEDQILSRMACLIDAGVLIKSSRDGAIHLAADHKKLSELVESDGNFDAAIDGLTKMDSYLN